MFILLASCQRVEFQSDSSTLGGSSKETLLNFEKVHIGDEQSLEFVLLNTAKLPLRPNNIEFQGEISFLENSFFSNSKTLKSNNPAVIRIKNINCPNLLKPKQNCKIEIIFKPKEIKKYEINLALNFKLDTESAHIEFLKILGEGIHDETLSIVSPLEGSLINSVTASSVVVSGTCSLEGATITVEPTSQKSRCVDGTYTTTLNLLSQPDGNTTLTVEMNTGHIPVVKSVTVIKDTTAPKVAITNPVNGNYVTPTNQSSYTVSGTCDLDGAMIFFNPTSATTTCKNGFFSKSLSLSGQPEGNLTISASIKDLAGNSSSSSVTVIKDTIAPKIAITSPADGSYVTSSNQNSYALSGTCDLDGAMIFFNPTSATTTCKNGSFSKSLNLSGQPEGNLTISASIKDSAGNNSSSSVTVIKDTIAPKIAITSPADGSYVTSSNQNSYALSGTCDLDGAMIAFNPTSVATACKNGSFSKSLNLSAQPEGNLTISASIKDSAGNNSSSSVTVIKDTTGPQVTLGPASPNNVGIGSPVSFSVIYTDAASVNLTPTKVTLSGNTTECVVSVLNGTTQTPTIKLSDCSSTSGQVTVQIQKGTAQDALGNLALASNTQSVVVKNGEPFVAVYRISSDNMSLDLPLKPGLNYNFKVNWGDGTPIQTVTNIDDPDKKHTYTTTGDYTVTIRGLMEGYGATGWNDERPYQTQILSVSNLGDVGWKDLSYTFYKAYNLTTVKGGNTSNVNNMKSMFSDAYQANPDVSSWDTSKVTDMSWMFLLADQANPDVSNWDTSNVNNMKSMFSAADQANPDVSSWDTSKVTDMSEMFALADQANPDVSNWDTSNVNNMKSMFSAADQANPDVSSWDTSKVTDMSYMFSADRANPNVSNWDTSKVTNMSSMFDGASQANPDVSNWDTSNVNNMKEMFHGAIRANPNVSNWDTSKVTDMERMFRYASQANPDVSGWNTSNVTNMKEMFHGAIRANPNVSNWDTSKVTDMSNMFYDAISANPDTSGWSLESIFESSGKLLHESGLFQFFYSSNYNNLTTVNYSTLLIKLASSQAKLCSNPTCSLNVGNVKYRSSAQSARNALIDNGWNITDGGQQ